MHRRTFVSLNTRAGLALAAAGPARLIPPAEQGLTFLFQGDSITDGNRGRTADPNHTLGHGYAYGVASRIGADFPERDCQFYNRGISGNTIGDLHQRWATDTLALKPDVLSILIGINDAWATLHEPARATTPAQFEIMYRQLLTESRAQQPRQLLVLGLPFAYPVGPLADNWDFWRADVAQRQAVVRRLAAEFDAVLVDYPAVLERAMARKPAPYWIWDGIHPTVFAHEWLSRAWLQAVSARLPFLSRYRTDR
ncbi:SGNH/GDSL hydrolase family protein [Spirosoma luteolum]